MKKSRITFASIALARAVRIQMGLRLRSQARYKTEPPALPHLLLIETSSLCNLACAKCGLKTSTRKRGLMDKDRAFEILDQAQAIGIRNASLSMLGEPLMHPDLEDIIAHARQANIHTYFTTNALLLTPERSRELIKAGIGGIRVSIDGWDKQSYEKRLSHASLDQVLENLERFREARGNQPAPMLGSVTVLDRESKAHLAQVKSLLLPHVDQCDLTPLTDFGIPGHRIDPELLAGKSSLRRLPCAYLWSILSVAWDGRVTACCNDHNLLLGYHHIDQASLEQIWQSPTINKFRKLHLDRQFHKMPMCRDCTRDWCNSLSFHYINLRFTGP